MLTNFCFLCGLVLSFRFRISILIPATLIAWALALIVGLLMQHSGGMIALDIVVAAAALQLGYLAGTVSMAGVVALRRSRQRNWLKKPVAAR